MTFGRRSPQDQLQMFLIKTTPSHQIKTHILLQSNRPTDLLIISARKTTLLFHNICASLSLTTSNEATAVIQMLMIIDPYSH